MLLNEIGDAIDELRLLLKAELLRCVTRPPEPFECEIFENEGAIGNR